MVCRDVGQLCKWQCVMCLKDLFGAVCGVGSNSVIRYGDFLKLCSLCGGVFLLYGGPSLSLQLRLFAVYSSISDAVNGSRAGRWGAEVHLPSMGIHERGATLFPRTGAVMLGVS